MENKRPEMLDYSVTKQPDSIEVLFCEPLDKNGQKEQMSNDLSKVFLTLCMAKDQEIDEIYNRILSASTLSRILKSRAEFAGLKMDKKSLILLSCLCSSPGQAVMYVYYLLYKIKKLGSKELTFDKLGMEIFPFGFFTEETLDYFWDTQKVKRETHSIGTDNLLDYPDAMLSIASS